MMRLTEKCLKIFKTCNLYLCFLALGMSAALPGPCLLDLQQLMNTSMQQIAFIYTARYIGYVVGSGIGGIILDAAKSKQAVMTIFNLFSGVSMLGIPWSPNLGFLSAFMIVNGFSLGITDIGGNVLLLTLWGAESGPYYQGLHFNFGFGALVAPLIAAPFLGAYTSEDVLVYEENGTSYLSLNNFTAAGHNILANSDHTSSFLSFANSTAALITSNNSVSDATDHEIPGIVYPFTAIGSFILLVATLFLVTTIMAPSEGTIARTEIKNKVNHGWGFTYPVIILNFFLIFLICGAEIGYAQMLTTHVVKGPLQLTPSTGSYMTSTFWASFCLTRFTSVFLAIKFSNFTLIVADLVVTALGSATFLFLSSYEWSVWVSSVLLGAGMASFFASSVKWIDDYIAVTNKMASIFTVAGAVGQLMVPFIVSYFIEILPTVLIYVVPVCSILAIIIAFFMHMILRKKEKRILSQSTEMSNDNDLKIRTVSV